MASLWYCAAGVIARGMTFLVTPFFTRVLSGAEYGIFPLYSGWCSLISVLLVPAVSGVAFYGGLEKFKGRERDYTKSALAVLFLGFLAAAVIYFIFIEKIAEVSSLGVGLLSLLPLQVLSEGVVGLYLARERYSYGFKRVFLASVVPALTAPLLAVGLIPFIPAEARCVAAAVSTLIVAVWVLWRGGLLSGRVSGVMMRDAFSLSFTTAVNLLSVTLFGSLDRVVIGANFGTREVAAYSVAHSLGLMLTFFTVGIYGALKPWIIRKLGAGEREAVRGLVSRIFALGALVTVAVAALAPEAFSILAPEEYKEGLLAVYFFATAPLATFIFNVCATVAAGGGKAWRVSLISLIAAGAHAVLIIFALPRLSFIFGAVFYLLSYSLLAVLSMLFCGGGKVFGIGSLLAAAFAAIGVGGAFLLREAFAARMILVGGLLLVGGLILFGLLREVREK